MARLSNDPSFVQNLARQFSGDAQELVDAIATALVEKDYARSRELVHALKGSSMMTGAVRLRDSAARAEKIMDRHVGGEADDAIGNLRETLKATQHELQAMLPSEASRPR